MHCLDKRILLESIIMVTLTLSGCANSQKKTEQTNNNTDTFSVSTGNDMMVVSIYKSVIEQELFSQIDLLDSKINKLSHDTISPERFKELIDHETKLLRIEITKHENMLKNELTKFASKEKLMTINAKINKLSSELDKKTSLLESQYQEAINLAGWNKAAISDHISIFSIIMAASIGIIGVVVSIAIYMGSRDRKLIQKEHETELSEIHKRHKQEINDLSETQLHLIQQQGYRELLKRLIETPNPSPAEVYALLTPLTINPRKDFAPLFAKIIEKDINPEITQMAQVGLERIKKA